MKDTKFYPLLTISIVLLLASFIMLCFLGYNFYIKSQDQKQLATTSAKAANSPVNNTRDSLQKLYNTTIGKFQIASQLDSATLTKADSLQLNLDVKLTDFLKLRNEIDGLLTANSSIADLNLAKQKIDELQVKVDELKTRNIDIENENKRLNALLAQYITNNGASTQSSRQGENNGVAIEKNNSNTGFTATELRLAANNENNTEVSDAETAEKITGSFAVRTNANLSNAELMVVVLQPDGRVLKNAWESGTFETSEGKKVYSRKLKFDYTKGEVKRLNFSLDANDIQKGNYTMQLYNKGKLIGKTVKTVS